MKAILLLVSVLSIPFLNGCIDLYVSVINSSDGEPRPYSGSYAFVFCGDPSYGEVCHVVPCLSPGYCQAIGFNLHSTEYYVTDESFGGCGKLYFHEDENGQTTKGTVTIGYGARDMCPW